MGKNTINGGEVSLEISDAKPAGYSATSKMALSGDFEITASIRMSVKTLQQGQNRTASFSVVSDVAGQRANQAYIGILQKTVGYAATGGQYSFFTDMCIGSSWGRFNSRSLSGEPFRTFKIARKDGIFSTYYLEDGVWVKLSTSSDGFNDRVRVYFSIDTSWDATAGVTHSAVFNAIDMGAANPTAVLEEYTTTRPQSFTLEQNYPNPFNSATTIRYELPEVASIHLTIYDLAGQKVRTLVQGYQEAGFYSVVWDSRDGSGRLAASGMYLYRLEALDRGFAETKRIMLLR